MSQGTLIGIDQLVLGATTSCDLLDLDGIVVVPTGTTITPALLKQIKDSGIIGLIAGRADYVSHVVAPRKPALEVIASRISEMQKRSGITGSLSQSTLTYARGLLYDSCTRMATNSLPDIEELDNLVRKILHDTELLNYAPLPEPRPVQDSIYEQLIDSAIDMAIQIAWHMRRNQENPDDIKGATLGALLHDVGLLHIAREVVEKRGSVTRRERNEIHRHPYFSVRSIARLGDSVPQIARDLILMHHENVDGTGYPLKKKGPTIPKIAKLARVIDSYIALVSPRPHRRSIPPYRALNILLSDAGRAFDRTILRDFMTRIGIYPLGSAVVLSTNEIGVVVGMGKGGPMKPIVDIYFSQHHQFSQTAQRVDLGRERLKYVQRVV